MTPPVATPKIVLWFFAAAGLFFARALLFSTWLSRAPEVQAALSLNTVQMGLFVMLFPLGGLAGILFANVLTVRFGSTASGIGIFTLGGLPWPPWASLSLKGTLWCPRSRFLRWDSPWQSPIFWGILRAPQLTVCRRRVCSPPSTAPSEWACSWAQVGHPSRLTRGGVSPRTT